MLEVDQFENQFNEAIVNKYLEIDFIIVALMRKLQNMFRL